MSDRKKLIERIAALLRKAKGTTNEHEAETFLAKVQEMLEKHNIELHELGANQDDAIITDFEAHECGKSQNWKARLFNQIGHYYGCSVVLRRTRNRITTCLTGRQSSIETTKIMFPFILQQVNARGKQLAQDHKITNAQGSRYVANALVCRISELTQKQEEKEEARGYALVPVDMIKAVQDESFGDIPEERSRKIKVYSEAEDEANKISLHRQTSGHEQKLLEGAS